MQDYMLFLKFVLFYNIRFISAGKRSSDQLGNKSTLFLNSLCNAWIQYNEIVKQSHYIMSFIWIIFSIFILIWPLLEQM